MTVIVWDGTTLAADKMSCAGGTKRLVTKVRKIRNHLLAGDGGLAPLISMFNWWEAGCDPATFPRDLQKAQDDSWCKLWVVAPDKSVCFYEQIAVAITLEEPTFASGSGQDFAYGALAMGATAIQAVHIASDRDTGCGMGVDWLRHDPC